MSRLLSLAITALIVAALVHARAASPQAAALQAIGTPAAEAADVSVHSLAKVPGPAYPASSSSRTTTFSSGSPSDPSMLFDFRSAGQARWRVETDRVMGGRSTGSAEVARGTLVFTGEVVTEGGGFSSVRARRRMGLSGYDGVELRVRGGGRTFEIDVDDGTRSRGREVTRRGPVPTSDSWKIVRVPFDSLEQSAHGEPVSAGPLDRSAVQSIGIYVADGQDGPFRLEVDWIRAYREAE